MQIISKIKKLFTRNLAFSDSFAIKSGMPSYNNWTIKKAVKDGYKTNGWVYRAVTLIAKSAASVPWGVVNEKGEFIDHYLSDIINHPNESISRQDMFELIVSWLELSGNAYLKVVQAGRQASEIWPVSPDRLRPVLSKDIAEWIQGYALDMSTKTDYKPEEILHFKYFDPASPYLGIGPLQAVCKTVDVDVDQINWNKSAMQNRGVLDGVFSFKREFRSQDDANAIAEKLNERYAGTGNARKIGVVGSEAKYVRTSLTPVQMDFLDSRRFNRDEIFIIFGVPPQYAGTQESSTYNNYQTSELIFWFQKIIPLLDDLRDTFNFFFYKELGENKISYNLNNIPAIRRALLERSKTAKTLFDMGVPVSQLNTIFDFGIKEFPGWGDSHIPTMSNLATEDSRKFQEIEEVETRNLLLQTRDVEKEIADREIYSVEKSKGIAGLLNEQQNIIFAGIEDNANQNKIVNWINPEKLLVNTWVDWIDYYNVIVSEYSRIASAQIVVEKRAIDEELQALLDEYLKEEAIVLKEKSMIAETTIKQLIAQIEEGIENAWTISQLQQAIVDIGVFSPERALRLSRTITGTAGSMGQHVSAKATGATHKRWINSGFEVRDAHIERAMEPAVKINDRYSAKFGASLGPMYPLDLVLVPADRVNCFLPGTKIEGEFITAMKSNYHGKVVEIVTGSGNILRVTGKHPIFTEQGFVTADSIKIGDILFAKYLNEDSDSVAIERVFESFATIGGFHLRKANKESFHGDGQFIDGNIEVNKIKNPLLIGDRDVNAFIEKILFNKIAGSLVNSLFADILRDNVVAVSHSDYSGFVYDVEEIHGWLLANNLVVSNCRCSQIFSIE